MAAALTIMFTVMAEFSDSVTLLSMPWDPRSEAAKERIIAFGIILVLAVVAILFMLAFVGIEFLDSALG